MGRRAVIILALLSLLSHVAVAQEEEQQQEYQQLFGYDNSEEPIKIIEVDTTLFRAPSSIGTDPYSDATRYYQAQGASRRRGLYYTTGQYITEPLIQYITTLREPTPRSEVALYGAQSLYRVALRALDARPLSQGWSLQSSLWAQTGRDAFVEGVFRNRFSPEVVVSKRFEDDHFLTLRTSLYYSSQGLQYGSTAEAYELTGSNYYNPTWGFYNGKARNSRVRGELSPQIEAHYQRPIKPRSTLTLDATLDYSRQSNSSLGWYNAYTPTPDYYTKMPSYLPAGELKEYTTELWRTNNSDYTQVNWDELIRLNSLSRDGNAYYVLEERIKSSLKSQASIILHTDFTPNMRLSYGIEASIEQNRNFKVAEDLLGASHLMDYDQFMGDSYNKTLPLQNNLQEPDRKIVEGDRFGYDYSMHHTSLYGTLRATYSAGSFDIEGDGRIGSESLYRIGHYEKERFAGSASLGSSTHINTAPYRLCATIGYAATPTRYYTLKLLSARLAPRSSTLFLNETISNYLTPSLGGECINSLSLSFRHSSPRLTLSAELYGIISHNGEELYSVYDDLSKTMCRAWITQIAYSSYGVEVVAQLRPHHDLQLAATLALGHYFYHKDPYIELLDDYDFTQVSAPTTSRMSGINIGNTPQLSSTISLTYFGLDRYIFSLSSSLAAMRYEQPSLTRRSERLLSQAFLSDESATTALEQQGLDNIFDAELSAIRLLYLECGDRLMLRASIKNLLGDSDRIIYSRESNRISLQSVDGYFTDSTLRQGTLQYGAPRTIQLSVSYLF